MSTIEQPIESVLIQEANFLSAAPIITHTQQIATSLLLRRAANKLESLQKACACLRNALAKTIDALQRSANITDQTRGGWALKAADEAFYNSDCGRDYVHKSQLEAAQQRIAELEAQLDPAKQYDAHRKLREALANEKA